jgi:hypothetical protein
MFDFVRKTAVAAAIFGSAFSAGAANAAVGAVVDPCSAAYVSGAIACQGYYGKNLITGDVGSATTTDQQAIINLLLTGTASTGDTTPTNNTGAYNPPYALATDTVLGAVTGLNGAATLNFGSLSLSGLTVLGAHFGNNTDSDVNNVTAFWLLDLGSIPTSTVTLSNGAGSSNAQIFATGAGAVPEPGTWAMMLVGFGGMGVAMRRRRRGGTLLQQLA